VPGGVLPPRPRRDHDGPYRGACGPRATGIGRHGSGLWSDPRNQHPGIYQVVVEYQNEAAGRYATRAAVRLCQSIVETGIYPEAELRIDLADLRELRDAAMLGATTEALMSEAEARGIPWMELENCDLFQLGYGKHQKRVQAALTSMTNVLEVELASDKERTKAILESMHGGTRAGGTSHLHH